MTGLTGATPADPGGIDCSGVVAVEQIRAACVGPDVLRFNPIDKDQKRGAVGVLIAVSEPDRLCLGVPVANRAMRQEGGLLISP